MLAKIVLLGICALLLGCSNKKEANGYSFFVAGHVYGSPGTSERGLHKPFMDEILGMADIPFSFGVLTGDVVQNGHKDEWNELENDLDSLDVKIHFALGNHDYKNAALIKQLFPVTYYSFKKENDLHIVLDPNIDNWNISGEQLIFLRKTLEEEAYSSDNVFVYSHQLLWWAPDNDYHIIRINSAEGRATKINFWDEIAPLFRRFSTPVYMLAGDIGAAEWADDYSFDLDENIHLISSGMGEGKGDNFLNVKVLETKEVIVELISIPSGKGTVLN